MDWIEIKIQRCSRLLPHENVTNKITEKIDPGLGLGLFSSQTARF